MHCQWIQVLGPRHTRVFPHTTIVSKDFKIKVYVDQKKFFCQNNVAAFQIIF